MDLVRSEGEFLRYAVCRCGHRFDLASDLEGYDLGLSSPGCVGFAKGHLRASRRVLLLIVRRLMSTWRGTF